MSDPKEVFLYITSTGWKSGNSHEIEIWFVEYEGAYYSVSEHGEKSHWVQNIRRNPAVTIRLEGVTGPGMGRVIDPATEPKLAAAVKAAMEAKYKWGDGTIVEVKRVPA